MIARIPLQFLVATTRLATISMVSLMVLSPWPTQFLLCLSLQHQAKSQSRQAATYSHLMLLPALPLSRYLWALAHRSSLLIVTAPISLLKRVSKTFQLNAGAVSIISMPTSAPYQPALRIIYSLTVLPLSQRVFAFRHARRLHH